MRAIVRKTVESCAARAADWGLVIGEAYARGSPGGYGLTRARSCGWGRQDASVTIVPLTDAASSAQSPTTRCCEGFLQPFEALDAEDHGGRRQRGAGIPRGLRETLRDRARPRFARGLDGGVIRASGERTIDGGGRDDRETTRRRRPQVVVERTAEDAKRGERPLEEPVVRLGLAGEAAAAAPAPDEVKEAVDRADRAVDVLGERGHRELVGQVAHSRRMPGTSPASASSLSESCPDGDHPRPGRSQGAGSRESAGARRAGDQHDAARERGSQSSVARMPAVDSITGRIFFSSASKNIDSGNSSSSTSSV